MARPGISFEAVQEAATALLDEQQTPTVQRVRERLGRGSHSTIAAHLRRFHETRTDADEVAPPPPAALMQRCQQLWEEALTLATDTLAGERQALAERERQLLSDREELLRRYQWLRATLAQRDAELSHHREEHQRLEQALAAERLNAGSLSGQLDRLGQQLAGERQQAASTEAQLRQTQTLLQAEAETQRQLLLGQLESERCRAEEQQRLQLLEVDRLRQENARQRRGAAQAREQFQARERALQEERRSLVEARVSWESRARDLAQRLGAMERVRAQLERALTGSRRTVIQLRERLARRSGRAAAAGGDGRQGGASGGVDGH